MNKTPAHDFILKNIAIAAPCNVDWNSMPGNDRVRACGQCSQNVYDLSAMSKKEATALLENAGELPCLRFFRRNDGTIMFDNCPVGLRKIRNAIKRTVRIAAMVVAWLVSMTCAFAKDDNSSNKKNIDFTWTLSENGPLNRAIQWPEPPRQLAQLGVPSRVVLEPRQTQGLGADWLGAEAFLRAIEYNEKQNYEMAQLEFKTALEETTKRGADPMYREFVANEYAKLLRRTGKSDQAETVERTNKLTATDLDTEQYYTQLPEPRTWRPESLRQDESVNKSSNKR